MIFSKLFVMMAFGVSLNNSACCMKQLEHDMEKTGITKYNKAATQELQTLLNNHFYNVSEEKIKELLTSGADPNIKADFGWTLLHYAADKCYKECIQLLVYKGADVNAKNTYDQTPLHRAAYKSHSEALELLLEAGAHPNIQENTYGATPLHAAASWGYQKIVILLLKHGADLNKQDKDGWTPLHNAAYYNHKGVFESIINFIKDGVQISNDENVTQLNRLCSLDKIFKETCEIFLMANKRQLELLKIPKPLCYEILVQLWDQTQFITELVNAKNNKGETALDLARKKGHKEIAMLLEPYEKK